MNKTEQLDVTNYKRAQQDAEEAKRFLCFTVTVSYFLLTWSRILTHLTNPIKREGENYDSNQNREK